MKPFKTLTSRPIRLPHANVDTDLIIPSRFLKTMGRSGLATGAFASLRSQSDNPFDRGRVDGSAILISGENFGCGSSREHAAWAILEFGIRAIIAPSFAEIFSSNAFKNGLLLVAISHENVNQLLRTCTDDMLTIDLERRTVMGPDDVCFDFDIDPFRRRCLLDGLAEIDLTLQMASHIDVYERMLVARRPWLPTARRLKSNSENGR